MTTVIKDYSYESGLADDLTSKQSLLNGFEFTDELSYDQKYEVDAQGVLTGGIIRTNRSGTRVQLNNIDNALQVYEDEILRTYLSAGIVAFADSSGIDSGGIVGSGAQEVTIFTSDDPTAQFIFSGTDVAFYPTGDQDLGTLTNPWGAVFADGVVASDLITDLITFNNNRTIRSGTGSPESSVTADIGSIYLRADGGAGTSFYVKESGSGNTGWVAK